MSNFNELLKHTGHKIVIATYGQEVAYEEVEITNVAIECETCYEVLTDYEREGSNV